MLSHTVMLWSVTEIEFEFFHGIFSTFKCSYFCFLYVLTFGGQHLNVRHLYQSYLCCFAIAFFLIEICISSDSIDNSDTAWLTCKQWPQKVNTYNEAKNLFDLSYNMSPKAGVWVPGVFWGGKIKCSFQAFHPYLELRRDESNEFRSC